MPQHIGSKWRKTVALMRSKPLRRLIPETTRYDRARLIKMLNRYGMVYVKPETGTHGKGVMRVARDGKNFRYQLGKQPRVFHSYGDMANELGKRVKGRRYLIQRGIRLLKHKGRAFDLRVMAQVNPGKKWETTGIIGRVAAPRKIVTNYHDGGKLVQVRRLLSGHMGKSAMSSTIRRLESVGVLAGQAMRSRYSGIREVGVDVGLDRTLTPWIIEVNTSPDPYIFRKLPDPSVFRKIRKYQRAYRRK